MKARENGLLSFWQRILIISKNCGPRSGIPASAIATLRALRVRLRELLAENPSAAAVLYEVKDYFEDFETPGRRKYGDKK